MVADLEHTVHVDDLLCLSGFAVDAVVVVATGPPASGNDDSAVEKFP